MKRVPRIRKPTPEPEPDVLDVQKQADRFGTTEKLELAIAEAMTGKSPTEARKLTGLSKTAFQKELRRAQRDTFAIERDTKRLKVINRMWSVMESVLNKLSKEISDPEEPISAKDLLSIMDKLGLRLACLEQNRTSIAEDLTKAGDERVLTRERVDRLRVKGNLSPEEQRAVDKLLGLEDLPSGAITLAPSEYEEH